MTESIDSECNHMCGICYEILSSFKKCKICSYKICNECFNQYIHYSSNKICPHCRISIPECDSQLYRIWYDYNQVMFIDNSNKFVCFSEKIFKKMIDLINCIIYYSFILSFMLMSWLIGYYITKKKDFIHVPFNFIIGAFIIFIPVFCCIKLCKE